MSKTTKTILIDMDSTLADLTSVWFEANNKLHSDNLTEDKVTDWDVSKFAKAGGAVYDILKEPGFFTTLDPFPGAVDFVEDLHDTKMYNILVVTAPPSNNPHTWTDKYLWFKKHLGFLGEDSFVCCSQKALIKADIYFDDSPHNIRAFRAAHPDAYVISWKYGWNRDVWDLLDMKLCDPRNEKAWYRLFEDIENLP